MNGSFIKCWVILLVVVLGLVAWTAPTSAGGVPSPDLSKPTGASCESLANLKLKDTTITSATIMNAGPNPPPVGTLPVAICRVVGAINTNINFEVWMPTTGWNGKFNGVGNGALAGFINYEAMSSALARGYATASTDTGHGGSPVDGAWALNRPDLLVDFGYLAIHLTTDVAKAVVQAYYGQGPRYSYFTGCSGGGQMGLMEAQRYPKDYDGVVSGAPANDPTRMWPGELWPGWVAFTMGTQMSLGGPPGPPVPTPKLLTLNQAAVNACDAADGVVDGVINDPRKCNFNPQVLLCPANPADPNKCLTQAEIDTVKKVYAGLKDPTTGKQFWPGYEKGSEDQWSGHINPFSIPLSYFKYMVYKNPSWDYTKYDLTSAKNFADLYKADRQLGPILDAVDPNLTPFMAHGGKLIMYHGWADQNIAPQNSINYLVSVKDKMGNRKTEEFLRLFMVPGMNHCSGGAGTDTFDSLGALAQWVEHNKAPDKIIASNLNSGVSRPLCPYPQVAKYKGTGSPNDAANFVCANPK